MLSSYIILSLGSIISSYAVGILYALLYSIVIAIILIVPYYLVMMVFNYLKSKMSWIASSLICSFISALILVKFLYFYPYFFLGWDMDSYTILAEYYSGYYLYFVFFYNVALHILYIALLLTPMFVLLSMYFSYLSSKVESDKSFFRTYTALLILSFTVLIINIIFPWILGGILLLVYL